MLYHHLTLISLALWFPSQIAALCSDCDSYTSALKSCQKTSANVTQIGSAMDTDSVHCMCISSSSYTEMNSCSGCTKSNFDVALSVELHVLSAWTTTCKADNQFGDKQAAACWQGQPTDFMPCVSKTTSGSGGGGSGTLTGGSSSSSETTLPQSTSGSSAATPSASAKSAGPPSFSMSMPLSVLLIAFGMLIGL
ncbi:MAG: hypothetical protein HETSPECPRED_002181 [Heterodermia speciosa]|uniref:Secreted protein n=1 Tax=Heterodermia speciosa TaxID=116794 RepID=A0A8H3J3P3_9LECA|nr:MAG: hypothetical protein HETSPECPRED_002181 [Heterodermia speciosa]